LGTLPAVSFELSAPLPDFPDKLQVYKMVKPEINEKYVKALGAKFGLEGEISEWPENFLMGNDKTRTYLQVYKSTGTFKYTEFPKLYPDSETVLKSPPVLPPDAEALKIATDFLVERDLLPKGDVAYRVDVGASFGEIPTCLLVSFQHAIEIAGPGARHGLRIGDRGEVVQVFINPTNPLELPPLEMVAVKSVQQAYLEMKNNTNYHVPAASRKVKIDSVAVAYWLEAIGEGQDYVAPVYKFQGSCFDAFGKQLEVPFVSIMEAVKLKFTHSQQQNPFYCRKTERTKIILVYSG
jgi:hypothetical protein